MVMYNKTIIDALLISVSLDTQGIYPQAMVDVDGTRKERTPWQEGWNACHIKLRQNACLLGNWFEKLSKQEKEDCLELLLNEVINLSAREEMVRCWLQMNDTFGFACADGEDIEVKDFEIILHLWRKYGYDGLIAWAAHKRSDTPLESLLTKDYLMALNEVERLYRDD